MLPPLPDGKALSRCFVALPGMVLPTASLNEIRHGGRTVVARPDTTGHWSPRSAAEGIWAEGWTIIPNASPPPRLLRRPRQVGPPLPLLAMTDGGAMSFPVSGGPRRLPKLPMTPTTATAPRSTGGPHYWAILA